MLAAATSTSWGGRAFSGVSTSCNDGNKFLGDGVITDGGLVSISLFDVAGGRADGVGSSTCVSTLSGLNDPVLNLNEFTNTSHGRGDTALTIPFQPTTKVLLEV